MPDITRKTISATQVPALFNVSPYVTRWMLYKWLRGEIELESPENSRMAWGSALERVILDAAALELGAEVHTVQQYLTNNLIGATVETICLHPTKGWGVIEAKNVDRAIWYQSWTETAAPKHVEMQLQAEMLVGNGNDPFEWGAIACFIGGNELRLYERTRDHQFCADAMVAASKLFSDVSASVEPEIAGEEIEVPFIKQLWPTQHQEPLSLNDPKWTKIAYEYEDARAQRLAFEKIEGKAKAALRGAAQDHSALILPGGARVDFTTVQQPDKVIKAHTQTRMSVKGVPSIDQINAMLNEGIEL